jgi:WXG100 family type VII secretion target
MTVAPGGPVQFGVDPEQVAAVAQQCQNTADEISSQLSALKNYVMDLEAQWHGIAAQTFQALMTDWDIYASMLNQSLVGIGQGLQGNWHNYRGSEDANIASLQKVNGSLPGTPGATIS